MPIKNEEKIEETLVKNETLPVIETDAQRSAREAEERKKDILLKIEKYEKEIELEKDEERKCQLFLEVVGLKKQV